MDSSDLSFLGQALVFLAYGGSIGDVCAFIYIRYCFYKTSEYITNCVNTTASAYITVTIGILLLTSNPYTETKLL